MRLMVLRGAAGPAVLGVRAVSVGATLRAEVRGSVRGGGRDRRCPVDGHAAYPVGRAPAQGHADQPYNEEHGQGVSARSSARGSAPSQRPMWAYSTTVTSSDRDWVAWHAPYA